FEAVRRGDADNVGTAPARKLGRELPHAPGGAGDEGPLPRMEPSVIEQALPGAERRQRDRRALEVVERRRLGGEQAGRGGGGGGGGRRRRRRRRRRGRTRSARTRRRQRPPARPRRRRPPRRPRAHSRGWR